MAQAVFQELKDARRDFWTRQTSSVTQSGISADESLQDNTLLCGLRLNLLETLRFLMPARPT